ncbi:c-type cytochrome biogenesis protein CcsB [Desulfotomaculum defluvii]
MIPITEQLTFDATLCLYALGAMLFLIYAVTEKLPLVKWAILTVGIGFLAHTAGLIIRTITVQRLPFVNMYEFVIFFAWGVILAYLVTQQKHPVPLLGTVVVPVAVLLLAAASIMNGAVRPLMPALQSYWLHSHVATAVLAYGAFGVSFGIGVLYLIRDTQPLSLGSSGPGNTALAQGVSLLPNTETLDKLLYRVIAFGFVFLTLVLITGAVWAEQAWGTWWSWDPKETWALITWLVYALFLHGRFTRGWQGRRTAWLAIFGFVAVIFTLFGVTWLMPGMHSYS